MESLTLLDLNRRIGAAVSAEPGLRDVWVTAETSDVRNSGPHCYMELLQKNSEGEIVARARAMIWGSVFARLGARFRIVTGSPLKSDMKVMVRVSATFHPVYGLSLSISDINPEYTAGDLVRRRNEIIERLRAQGILEANRRLPMPETASRIAIISARGAAGYGDFINHLYRNPRRLRFHTRLFPAALQGERTAESIIEALDSVLALCETGEEIFDCVVIIRGGGAVSDLSAYDSYPLAEAVARFPIPVIIGIGHERDITVLDFVAHSRVKTPTAAAELLIARQTEALEKVLRTGADILAAATEAINSRRYRLSYYSGQLPVMATAALERQKRHTDAAAAAAIADAAAAVVSRHRQKLEADSQLLEALSPEATLRRGFSITRFGGRAVTSADVLAPGAEICTILAGNTVINSSVTEISHATDI